MSSFHTSVLLQEVVDALRIQDGGLYIDATLGGGGHALAIAKKGGKVLGIDTDEDAISYVESQITSSNLNSQNRIVLVRSNFSQIQYIAENHGFSKVDGILFDVGVSSFQINTSERGFSFQTDGPLDMRMDRRLNVTAKDLVNGLTRVELGKLLGVLGEEKGARRIAQAIFNAREKAPIITTRQLAGVVEEAVGWRGKKVHPATKVFQALRIAVNGELENLENALTQSVGLLRDEGRLIVITFHSLEDRVVKRAFLGFQQAGSGKVVTKKPIVPGEDEVSTNPRSRSAKLRVFQRNNI